MGRVSLRFTSILLIFNLFPKIDYFYYSKSLHGLQDVEITALTWETGRKIPYLRFPCIILYIIGLWSMKLQNEKKSICSESRKKDTKTSTKRHELNGMTQNELFDIFSNAQA